MTSIQKASQSTNRSNVIGQRVGVLRSVLEKPDLQRAASQFPEVADARLRIQERLAEMEQLLGKVPPIDIAVLGPSRHGKSTLLNALAGQSLLPTSDIKPCTASILKMTWAPEWSVKVKFVQWEQLKADWQSAIQDAEDELRNQQLGDHSETNEDPRFIRNVLQRFIQLFEINPDLPPSETLRAVKEASIPPETAKYLGQEARVRRDDVEGMRTTIEKYLSTSDVFWTIVARCEIEGPFENWHPSLSLVDLPGTNDTDAQRTLVTNSVRDSATAVAVVTSDSNLGPDIESWLRHSSVLANFLEATNQRRQRLFIIRTKLDSYHPEISDEECRDLTEAEEAELFWKAVENYKDEQTQTYRAMLRDIASPKLPHGEDEASRAKRTELLSRIDEIPVYFVSALAHEVFTGRYQASRRTRNQLSEYFDEEIEKTGVPGLNAAFQNVAAEYLAANFYDDLERQLEQEARLLAGTFQRAITSLKAELAGGRDALQNTVSRVRGELIPWLRSEVDELENRFREKFAVGANGIHDRLRHADAMSVRRFDDKLRLWSNYHWASLRAAGRKKGSHMTSRGDCIDFAEDICSVLVDDVTVAWTHFRDDLIANEIESVTSRLVDGLQIKLAEYEQLSEQDEVRLAINQIAKQLSGITHQQRLQLLQLVNEKIREVESIRRPAYEIAQDEFAPVYRGISTEMGTGCATRIRQRLESEVPAVIDRIRRKVFELVSSSVSNLGDGCAGELGAFGDFATDRIEATVTHISTELIDRDETILNARIDTANAALKLLPANLETA